MATNLEFPERTISSVNTLSKVNYGCKTIVAMWVVQSLNIACLRISQQISYDLHFLYLFRIFPETMKHIPSSTLRGGLSKVENFSSLCLVIMNHHKPTPVKINSNFQNLTEKNILDFNIKLKRGWNWSETWTLWTICVSSGVLMMFFNYIFSQLNSNSQFFFCIVENIKH